jgi:hypothetical protein
MKINGYTKEVKEEQNEEKCFKEKARKKWTVDEKRSCEANVWEVRIYAKKKLI